jgi:alkylated DNA repair dioxygenase AlkB
VEFVHATAALPQVDREESRDALRLTHASCQVPPQARAGDGGEKWVVHSWEHYPIVRPVPPRQAPTAGPRRSRPSSSLLTVVDVWPWHSFARTMRAQGLSDGERSGVSVLIDLFDDGPDIVIKSDFLTAAQSARIFEKLNAHISWRQEIMRFGRREVLQPRLTAWYGDDGKTYVYSGIRNHPLPWIPSLLALKAKVESFAESAFNSVLLNYYRDGSDSVGWHADNEPELGERPVIASLSFGATRTFELRQRRTGKVVKLPLTSGSILVVRGATQHHWVHRVPKEPGSASRINLTFRFVHVNVAMPV